MRVGDVGGVRDIEIPATTATELKAWRLNAGRPDDDQLIIGTATAAQMDRWPRTTLRPLAKRLGIRHDIVSYSLRHSHASALHYANHTPTEAARRMGHSPVVHIKTYAHVIESLHGKRYDALIAAARSEAVVPLRFPDTAEG